MWELCGNYGGIYAESKDAYRDLAGYVEVPEQTASPESAPDPTEPKRDDTDIVLPSVDFETLRENGPDIIGWLSLPDTVLNYPVTQTDNNEYYLNHLYDGTYNKVGCLFADGWKRKTAALTAQRYSFTNRCCF